MERLVWSIDHPDLILGMVEARNIRIAPSGEGLQRALRAQIAERTEGWPTAEVKGAIRDLLRHGGYRPSGRNKPASEYLAGAASKGKFPEINNVVDINNMLSLRTGWPMSMLDLDRALGDAQGLEVRLGQPGEKYVFNRVGQEIDLKGLICTARVGGEALGNPVKDSMLAKTQEDTANIVAVLFASRRLSTPGEVQAIAVEYADLLTEYAGALQVRTWVQEQS